MWGLLTLLGESPGPLLHLVAHLLASLRGSVLGVSHGLIGHVTNLVRTFRHGLLEMLRTFESGFLQRGHSLLTRLLELIDGRLCHVLDPLGQLPFRRCPGKRRGGKKPETEGDGPGDQWLSLGLGGNLVRDVAHSFTGRVIGAPD